MRQSRICFSTGYNVTPYGGSNGSISLEVNAEQFPTIDLSTKGRQTDQNLENVPAGPYFVTDHGQSGLTYTVGITLNQPYILEMPTAISPNGDDQNDYFVVHGLDIYRTMRY